MQYHWILSVRYRDGTEATGDGTFDAKPGMTRRAAYQQLVEFMKEKSGRNEQGAVLFFELEPNQL